MLLASGRVKRRKRVNRLVEFGATLASFAAVAVLALMVGSVVVKALPALSWDLFTKNQATFGEPGGGIQNALVGSWCSSRSPRRSRCRSACWSRST